MADFIQITILILGAVSVPLYVTCLGEFRTFPFFPHTQKEEINKAHLMRLLSVISTFLTVSYSLALLGHLVGLGGFETMFHGDRLALFFMTAVAGLAFSIFSKRLDDKIYKMIQEYDDLLDEDFKVAKNKIRKEGRIGEILQRTTEEKEERAAQKERELEEALLRNYDLERRLEESEKRLMIADKRKDELEKDEEKKKLIIKTTDAEIDATEKQISLIEQSTVELEDTLRKRKKTLVDLFITLKQKQDKNEDVKKNQKKALNQIKDTKREIAKLVVLTKKVEKELEQLNFENVELERKRIALNQRLGALIKEKKEFERLIDETETQGLDDKDLSKVVEMLRKRIEKGFQD